MMTSGAKFVVLSVSVCLLALIITGNSVYGSGYGGFGQYGHNLGLGLGHLALLGAANLSALCILRGGTCTLPGSCFHTLQSHGLGSGYGNTGYNQFLCNTTTICCLPFQAITLRKVIYPSRRRYGKRRGGKRRGYGRRRSSSW